MDITPPAFIERDPAVIMAEAKTQLEQLLGRELQPAAVEQTMLQFIVYREVLLLNRFNAGLSQMLYQFSTAPTLDYIAGLVAVERIPSTSAGCTIKFTLVEGHGSVLIPEGTRVATSDGKVIFRVDDDLTVAAGVNEVEAHVIADVTGVIGNGYAPGTVTTILDALAFVAAVTNIDTTGGGAETETDEQLRERIKLAPSQYSTAGSRASYIFHAKSANPLITDVSVTSPTPGTVLIVPLTLDDETPDQVINDVVAACSAETVRPLTDTVKVEKPTAKEVTIEVDVTLLQDTDASDAKTAIEANITELAEQKRAKLGQDLVISQIIQASRVTGVYDVAVKQPADNVVAADTEFVKVTGITVTIKGFNVG